MTPFESSDDIDTAGTKPGTEKLRRDLLAAQSREFFRRRTSLGAATDRGATATGVWLRRRQIEKKAQLLASEDEVRAVTEVSQRLADAFPDLDAAQIEHVVRQSHEMFTGKPIRDFVPVLVERMARTDLLAQRKQGGHTAREGAQLTM